MSRHERVMTDLERVEEMERLQKEWEVEITQAEMARVVLQTILDIDTRNKALEDRFSFFKISDEILDEYNNHRELMLGFTALQAA